MSEPPEPAIHQLKVFLLGISPMTWLHLLVCSMIRLNDFRFRINETFLYEYDSTDEWRHQIRFEVILVPESQRHYPIWRMEQTEGWPMTVCGILPSVTV